MSFGDYLIVVDATQIIINEINVDPSASPLPPGYSYYPGNGQTLTDTYDPLYHFSYFADTTTLFYTGYFPYNAYPSGSAVTTTAPPDSRMSYDFTTNAWYWAVVTLQHLADNYAIAKQQGGVTIGGVVYTTDTPSIASYLNLWARMNGEASTATRGFRKSSTVVVNDTDANLLTVFNGVMDHWQRCVDAEKVVFDQIAAVTLTDGTLVAAAFDTAYAALVATPITRASGAPSWVTSAISAAISGMSVPTTFDQLTDGTTNVAFTTSNRTKLSGIATAATANSSDATLLNRANHTGTETADVITDGTTNKAYTATEKTKLSGIATNATANSSDATLLNRSNHTGTQLAATISDFVTSVLSAVASALAAKPDVWFGTTKKTAPVFYASSAVVASGAAVFQLTQDGTGTGTALMTNPNLASLNCFVSDATASYQMSGALSNGNKTLTVTANKLSTANILTGILGQVAANGATVYVQIYGQ